MKKRYENILLGVLFLCVAFLFVRLMTQRSKASDADRRVEITDGIVSELRTIAELTTYRYIEETAIAAEKEGSDGVFRRLKSVFMKDELALIVRCEVRLGYNLSAFDESRISVTDSLITIILPPVEVLDVIVNPSDVEVFDESGVWTDEEVQSVVKQVRSQVLERAMLAKTMELARKSGEKFLSSFLVAVRRGEEDSPSIVLLTEDSKGNTTPVDSRFPYRHSPIE